MTTRPRSKSNTSLTELLLFDLTDPPAADFTVLISGLMSKTAPAKAPGGFISGLRHSLHAAYGPRTATCVGLNQNQAAGQRQTRDQSIVLSGFHERRSHPPPPTLTEHMDVALGDGVEAAARQQDNVRFSGFCHCVSVFFCCCRIPVQSGAGPVWFRL